MGKETGSKLPAQDILEDKLVKLSDVFAMLKEIGITLSPKQLIKLAKPRRGAEKMGEQVIGLARQYGLSFEGSSIEEMEQDLRVAREMKRFESIFVGGATVVGHTRAVAESSYWQKVLTLYGLLCALSTRKPALERELKPIRRLMAQRKTKEKAESEPPPEDLK